MKPILFNTEMVKAILEGRKNQTRRIIKNKYENADIDWFENKYGRRLVYVQNDVGPPIKNPNGTTTHQLIAMEEIENPHRVGDILYVRETWCDRWLPDGYLEGEKRYGYKADFIDNPFSYGYWGDGEKGKTGVWKPSIFMPKEAARIFLTVTGIRAERLQDITHDQILKEGTNVIKSGYDRDDYEFCWINLWEPTCTKEDYRWNNNPWVWVIEFEVIQNV